MTRPHRIRYIVMLLVAVLGVILTYQGERILQDIEHSRIAARFHLAADSHADDVAHAYAEVSEALLNLYRFAENAKEPDWKSLHRFAGTTLETTGINSFCWYKKFPVPVALPATGEQSYFYPLKYVLLPPGVETGASRNDLCSAWPIYGEQIRAVARKPYHVGLSQIHTSDPRLNDDILLAIPLYRDDANPEEGKLDEADVIGVVAVTFSLRKKFIATHTEVRESSFQTFLLDYWQSPGNQVLASWIKEGVPDESLKSYLTHSRDFELGDRILSLRIEALPSWVSANSMPGVDYVFPLGILLTALLMLPLWILFDRIERFRRLEVSNQDNVTQLKTTRDWVEKLSAVVDQSPVSILITDTNHRIEYVNRKFTETTGYASGEVCGHPARLLRPNEGSHEIYETMYTTAERGEKWQGEFQTRRRDGSLFWESAQMFSLIDAEGKTLNYVVIKEDITARREAQRRIEDLAFHDVLTGLPNRALLLEHFNLMQAQAQRAKTRIAVMYMDLNRFKSINDSLGHAAGDKLLWAITDRIRSCLCESDTLGRQGGDEFIALISGIADSEMAARVAEKINLQMFAPFEVQNTLLATSFSIGIAVYPDNGDSFDVLLQRADIAMYHAKRSGQGDYCFYTEQMEKKALENFVLENRLRKALENREFVLHYQPQFDLETQTFIGVEALVRWRKPDGELVPPGSFIPVVEETGLIIPLGRWILEEACRQAQCWRQMGFPHFTVAVNLSAAQFRQANFVDNVINALLLSNIDPDWIELELTESILLRNTEEALATVRQLKDIGIRLSIDDFGTGYSSLSYLSHLSVDKLKIDQSFVRNLERQSENAAIISAIVQMAHSLKLKTIAEGVESEQHACILKELHCDEIQGYWIARPMPADALTEFIKQKTGVLLPSAAVTEEAE